MVSSGSRWAIRLLFRVASSDVRHLPGVDVELPAVQLTGEDAVLDVAEPGQVGTQVRAVPLHEVVAEPPHLVRLAVGLEPVLDVDRHAQQTAT